MTVLYILCAVLLAASFFADRSKTLKGLKIALLKLLKILPAFGIMLVLVSIVLYFFPEEVLIKYLGKSNSSLNILISALIGSIAMIPGFIAFPLCGILKDSGVTWSVIAAFSSSLMLVGVVSFPIEKQYLGTKTAVIRNAGAFLMSLVIAFVIGVFYGDFI